MTMMLTSYFSLSFSSIFTGTRGKDVPGSTKRSTTKARRRTTGTTRHRTRSWMTRPTRPRARRMDEAGGGTENDKTEVGLLFHLQRQAKTSLAKQSKLPRRSQRGQQEQVAVHRGSGISSTTALKTFRTCLENCSFPITISGCLLKRPFYTALRNFQKRLVQGLFKRIYMACHLVAR